VKEPVIGPVLFVWKILHTGSGRIHYRNTSGQCLTGFTEGGRGHMRTGWKYEGFYKREDRYG